MNAPNDEALHQLRFAPFGATISLITLVILILSTSPAPALWLWAVPLSLFSFFVYLLEMKFRLWVFRGVGLLTLLFTWFYLQSRFQPSWSTTLQFIFLWAAILCGLQTGFRRPIKKYLLRAV